MGKYDFHHDIDGLVQERHNSSALAMELCHSCPNPLIHKRLNSSALAMELCHSCTNPSIQNLKTLECSCFECFLCHGCAFAFIDIHDYVNWSWFQMCRTTCMHFRWIECHEYSCEWNWYLNELDITIHVIASQLSGHCDVISNRLWCHQQNKNQASETRGRCVKIIVFIVIYRFVMSCKKWNNVCTLMMNCFCAHLSVILVFISLVPQLGK